MEKMVFHNEEVRRLYEEKVRRYEELANSPVNDTRYLWDAGVRQYAVTMEHVKSLLLADEIREVITSRMIKNMDMFLAKCSNAEFHIALVGAIKAGKSTLINALLGYEYASTKVTPETAALTKFKKMDQNCVRVVFYTSEEWDTL